MFFFAKVDSQLSCVHYCFESETNEIYFLCREIGGRIRRLMSMD